MATRAVRIVRWSIVALVALVLAVELATPSVVRYAIMSQASKALRTKVRVGQVDMSFWSGRIRIQDLAVLAPSAADERPLIGWRLLEVTLGYRDLFRRMIRVREIVLDTPRIALDRLADGNLN